MPLYSYECLDCALEFDARMPVDQRDWAWCPRCTGDYGAAERKFTPTANIAVPEAFRHDQSRFLPPKDSPAWETMDREGRTRTRAREGGLKDEFRKAGLL